MDARRVAHGHAESVRSSNQSLSTSADELNCPNTNSQIPYSQEYSEAITAVPDCATTLLENVTRDRSRLWALLSVEHGWQSWSNDDEDWTKSAK